MIIVKQKNIGSFVCAKLPIESLSYRSLFIVHPPVYAAFEIVEIIRILAHALTFHVRDLGNIHSVAGRCLHYDIQGLNIGIICYVGSDTERYFGFVFKVSVYRGGPFKIKTVRKQQRLSHGVDPKFFVMLYHLIAPFIRIAAVVSYTRK